MADYEPIYASRLEKIYKGRNEINGEPKPVVIKNYFVDTYEDTPLGNFAQAGGKLYPGGRLGTDSLLGYSFTSNAWKYGNAVYNWWQLIIDRTGTSPA